jgi:hypothetical protein
LTILAALLGRVGEAVHQVAKRLAGLKVRPQQQQRTKKKKRGYMVCAAARQSAASWKQRSLEQCWSAAASINSQR